MNDKLNFYRYHTNPESLELYDQLAKSRLRFALYHTERTGERLPKRLEPHMLRNPVNALGYALIVKQRIPTIEQFLLKSGGPYFVEKYAEQVMKQRWPEAEKIIKKNPESAYYYAKNVIKGRWPQAEAIIAQSKYAADYARDVIKGRWREAEEYIASDPDTATEYATDVIKGRWPPGEDAIVKDADHAMEYARTVLNKRWPRLETLILQSEDEGIALDYAVFVINGRWPAAESVMPDLLDIHEYKLLIRADARKKRNKKVK